LRDFLVEGVKLGFHGHTIETKILLSQLLTVFFECALTYSLSPFPRPEMGLTKAPQGSSGANFVAPGRIPMG
jgi:hypothetical protein